MASNYTNAEYAEMLILYGENNRNANAAARAFGNLHNRNPDGNVLRNLVRRTAENKPLVPERGGSFDGGRPRTSRNPANEEEVLAIFHADPTTSTRCVSRRTGVSRMTVHRVLKDAGHHPYHIMRVQNLQPRDYEARLEFCRWVLRKDAEDENFLKNILFTDESSFGRIGTWNTRNYHEWSQENPRATAEVRSVQTRFGVNLWAGILGNRIIGPFQLVSRLNGRRYHRFLRRQLRELLRVAGVPEEEFEATWFQHDGAPPHSAREVRDWLNACFGARCIGRGLAVPWPARSPDLNPLDFFIWGFIKETIYRTLINNQRELDQRIDAAFSLITSDMIINCRRNFVRRVNCCIASNGGHFQHLL